MNLSDKINHEQGQLPAKLSAEEYYDAAMYLLGAQDPNPSRDVYFDEYGSELALSLYGDYKIESMKRDNEARAVKALACLVKWFELTHSNS